MELLVESLALSFLPPLLLNVIIIICRPSAHIQILSLNPCLRIKLHIRRWFLPNQYRVDEVKMQKNYQLPITRLKERMLYVAEGYVQDLILVGTITEPVEMAFQGPMRLSATDVWTHSKVLQGGSLPFVQLQFFLLL